MVKKWKKYLLDWLLRDKELRQIALRDLIRDIDVKQVSISNAKNLTISNCIVIHSHFHNNRNLSLEKNLIEDSIINNNMMTKDNQSILLKKNL